MTGNDQTDCTNFQKITFIREEIRFQHGLIGTRISWLLVLESFLFTAFAISMNNHNIMNIRWLWHWLLPCVGGLIALLALIAIWGAIDRINEQRELLSKYNVAELLGRYYGEKWDTSRHSLSLLFPKFAPVVFFFAWISVFLLTLTLKS